MFSNTYRVGAGAKVAAVSLLFSVTIAIVDAKEVDVADEVVVLFLEDEVVVAEEEVARA